MISIITAFEIINQGISVFKFLNQSDAATQRVPSTVEDVTHMLSASTAAITEVIQTGNAQVIDKIERDKMETLSSRIGNLEMLLRMGERDRLFNYLLTVQESVDYARNRYLEGKPQWFVPYLSGRSVVLASFSHLGNIDQTSMRALQSEIKVEMHKLLDQVVERCVARQIEIPWEEIESVLTLSDGGVSRLIERLTPYDTFSQAGAQSPVVTLDAPAELIIEPKATPTPLPAPVTPVPLTSPPARHANLTTASHHVAVPAPHAQRAASSLADLTSIFERLRSEWNHFDDVFFLAAIPEKKMFNLLGSAQVSHRPERVYMLIDATVFGSAKNGLLVDDYGVHLNNDWSGQTSGAHHLAWREFVKYSISVDGYEVILSPSVQFNTSGSNASAQQVHQVLASMQEHMRAYFAHHDGF